MPWLHDRLRAAPPALAELPPPVINYLAAMVAVRWRQMTELNRVHENGVSQVVLFDEIKGTFVRLVDPCLGTSEAALVRSMEKLLSRRLLH
jgi:hypothetical protein